MQERFNSRTEAVSPELRRYAADAARRPTLLAARLARVGLPSLCERLGCGEAAALRLLICETPTVAAWSHEVALIAAYAGVEPARLDRLLRRLGVADPTDWAALLERRSARRVGREPPPTSPVEKGRGQNGAAAC